MGSRTTFLAENFQRLATDVGYADASGLGCGWVWINPNEDSFYYVLRLPWPEDIMLDLVSTDNPYGQITNSDLDLAAPGPVGSNHGSLARDGARGAGSPRTAQSLLPAL